MNFNEVLRKIVALSPEDQDRYSNILKSKHPEQYRQFQLYLKLNPAAPLEAMGYEYWLKRLGPHTFTRPFAPIQRKFWEWNWNALQKVLDNEPLEDKEKIGFLPWPRETGKCLAFDTEILKADGSRIPIQDVQRGDRLLSINQASGQCVPDTVTNVWDVGIKDCVRIRLRSGKLITLTPEHRLWTLSGWKPASGLVVGERVAAPRRTRPKNDEERSDAEVKLLAYMIAEGCTVRAYCNWITKTGEVKRSPSSCSKASFTNADRVIVEDFKTVAASMGFGVNQVRHNSERAHITYGLVGAQQWLREAGLSGKGAHEKRVPAWVFGLPERQRWIFLAALVDTDGYITGHDGLSIALANKELIADIAYLFTSVGVPSKVSFKRNQCRGAWILNASKGASRLCYERMPLLLKLDKLRRIAEKNQDSLLDAYPALIGRNLPAGVNRAIRNAGGPRLGSGSYPILTRSKLRRATEYHALPQWLWLEQSDLMWDEIRAIENVGPHRVYDIQMRSPSENFIANGVVSHNSSNIEWACIAEGALLKQGYVIYLAGKLSQAVDHVAAIRDRIESEKVAELYPWIGSPKLGTHKNKFGWGQEFLMTKGGWAIRPVGADVAMRGGKAINIRPTLIVVDDYDELGDSPHVVEHKEHMLTRAILPMGNANTRVLVPQNPIHDNSVVNRMLTGASLALAVRTVFGEINDDSSISQRPIPAVKGLVYEVRHNDEGNYCEIMQGESNWPGISVKDWQGTLNRVGPEAFKAEYQHDLEVNLEERVLPEYDDRKLLLHVISWDSFERLYGERRIPAEWPCDLGLDIGYSGGPKGHLSSWSFITRVPEGWPLAGSVFRYRGRNFKGVSIDDQSAAVQRDMWPGEAIERQWMSHEKLGEKLLLNGKHSWHFHPCESSKEGGWPAWRHYLKADRSQPHPFHVDTKDGETGLWRLGRPAFFDIVVHSQIRNPVDDLGMKIHRDSSWNQRRRRVKLTEAGLTVDQPEKIGDDPNDSSRMIFASPSFGPSQKPMTHAQKVQAVIPVGYHRRELERRTDLHPNDAHVTAEMAEWFASRQVKPKVRVLDQWGQPI